MPSAAAATSWPTRPRRRSVRASRPRRSREAEHGRHAARHGKDESEQAPRAPARTGRHQTAHGIEEPLAPAALGEHEQRRKEADGGAEVADRVARGGRRQRADGDERRGSGDGGDRLDRPARPHDRGGQRAREREQGENEGSASGTGGSCPRRRAHRGPTCSVRLTASGVAPSRRVRTTRAG
jgi:hypothetical protein